MTVQTYWKGFRIGDDVNKDIIHIAVNEKNVILTTKEYHEITIRLDFIKGIEIHQN